MRGQIARAHDLGITSVPTFIFAGTYAVTGAQDVRPCGPYWPRWPGARARRPPVGTLIPQQRTAPAADDDTRVA